MNPDQFRAAYRRLQRLDERLTYKVRPRSGAGGFSRPSHEQLDDRVRDLANFTVELKEILDDMFQAIAAKPGPPQPPGAEPGESE